ncbi:LysR family transcriptional regulator [Endozoicomonas lisbonensis]|uniref:LysR family transcriptional regulator AphB n=1 Tax=Endozoicomonas lisbonensis TaxID=3120522 RepID=A0ABV2SMX7_9GAMM
MDSIFGNIDDLYLLCTVIEEGSLQKAAVKLQLPVSTMSRRLSALEARLSVRLLQKQGRELVATEAGAKAYRSLMSGMEQIELSFSQLVSQQTEVAGKLNISMPHNFYKEFVSDVIERFLQGYPGVHFDLTLCHEQAKPETNRDLVLTFDVSNMQDMVARPLFNSYHGIYASKQYLEQHGSPETIRELYQHQWLNVDHKYDVTLFKGDNIAEKFHITPRLVVYDIRVIIELVEKGLGIAFLPTVLTNDYPDLVRLLPEYNRQVRQAYIVYRDRKYQPKLLTMFVNEILQAASSIGA